MANLGILNTAHKCTRNKQMLGRQVSLNHINKIVSVVSYGDNNPQL